MHKGGDPKTDHEGDDSDPGLASRRDLRPSCHKRRVLSNQRGTAAYEKGGEGAQRPHCAKGRGPREPWASWRHLLFAGCRSNRRRAVGQTVGEDRPTSLAFLVNSRHSVFSDKVLNFPAVPSATMVPNVLLFRRPTSFPTDCSSWTS